MVVQKHKHLSIGILYTLTILLSYVSILYAGFFSNPEDNENYTDQYLQQILDLNLCKNYTAQTPLSLKQAINLTVACNRNIHKNILNRITDNYNLSVTEYKFKPNVDISMRTFYEKTDNDVTTDTNKALNVIPQFKILTPLGTIINLDWENYISNPNNINTFRNASRITVRQPLLKQAGIDYQTANVKNAQASNKFEIIRLYDFIASEINNTIFLFRQIIQNENQLTIQENALAISKKLQEQTNALIKAGRLAQYELSQVESQVASQEINLADAKINLRKSYLQLANQLGIDSNNLKIKMSNELSQVPDPIAGSKTELLGQVLKYNINYQNVLLQENNAKRDYFIAYNQSRWTLDLTASYQIEGNDNTYTRSLQNYFSFSDQRKFVGLEFDIPFDLNPIRKQAVIENKVRMKQLLLDQKQLEQEIYSDLEDKLYQQQILWEKLQLSTRSVDIKQKNFDMARKKYEVGRLSSFELVRIQDDVENAQMAKTSNVIAYLNNATILDKMLNKTMLKWNVEVKIA